MGLGILRLKQGLDCSEDLELQLSSRANGSTDTLNQIVSYSQMSQGKILLTFSGVLKCKGFNVLCLL